MAYTIKSMGGRFYLEAQAHSDALTMIAIGEDRETTRAHLFDSFPELAQDEIADILADGLREAIASGVAREDIDASWTE